MKARIQRERNPDAEYPRLFRSDVNENLIVMALNYQAAIVLAKGGSMHTVGSQIRIDSSWKPFYGELVLSND